MTMADAETGLQLRSNLKSTGELELTLARVPIPECKENEVVIRVEATPINPSDLGLLIGPADVKTLKVKGAGEQTVVTASVPQAAVRAMAARLDQPMQVGNEGAGVVVRTGSSPEAQKLMGRMVAGLGGSMYAQYRKLRLQDLLVLPEGTTAAEGASCFVNPLTALSMPETMRMEGHKALIHTAAASNLGQMLNKICIADGVTLVNIVRSAEQEQILRDIGAKYVLNSTAPNFMEALIDTLAETGATLAFDAIGGGPLAGQLIVAMEAAANRTATEYSRYGSAVHKQVYIYGRLDMSPTVIGPGVGMAWGVGGYLLTYFLQKVGPQKAQALRDRVVRELKTTFASHYTRTISLMDALKPEVIEAYNRKSTGEKFLINPNLGL
jgi:NADPH:quinone reductase